MLVVVETHLVCWGHWSDEGRLYILLGELHQLPRYVLVSVVFSKLPVTATHQRPNLSRDIDRKPTSRRRDVISLGLSANELVKCSS